MILILFISDSANRCGVLSAQCTFLTWTCGTTDRFPSLPGTVACALPSRRICSRSTRYPHGMNIAASPTIFPVLCTTMLRFRACKLSLGCRMLDPNRNRPLWSLHRDWWVNFAASNLDAGCVADDRIALPPKSDTNSFAPIPNPWVSRMAMCPYISSGPSTKTRKLNTSDSLPSARPPISQYSDVSVPSAAIFHWKSNVRWSVRDAAHAPATFTHRIAVDGIPSSSASNRIFFMATIWPVLRFLPLYTTPYVPKVPINRKENASTDVRDSPFFYVRPTYLRQFFRFSENLPFCRIIWFHYLFVRHWEQLAPNRMPNWTNYAVRQIEILRLYWNVSVGMKDATKLLVLFFRCWQIVQVLKLPQSRTHSAIEIDGQKNATTPIARNTKSHGTNERRRWKIVGDKHSGSLLVSWFLNVRSVCEASVSLPLFLKRRQSNW